MQRASLALLAALCVLPCAARDVTVNVCGQPQTYTRVPQRAVTHDVNITEMFLFLGLADRLAGYSGIYASKEISPQLAPVLARVPNLSQQGMNLENIVAARADFVFGGWSYGFRPGGVTPELLARYGIPSYVLTESCVRVQTPEQRRERVALEDAFADMDNVARIFGVQQQAAPRIQQLREGLATLRKEMRGNTHQPKVFVFDSGEKSPTTVGRYGMPQAMMEAAGARNIFDDIASNWPKGNWEDVVLRDPEWIVIIDYGTPSAQGKIDFLLQKKELQTVAAIREKRFFVMTYAEATPGPRNVETAQRLAAALHPDRRITVTPVRFNP
ncbi:MAG: ABC transporter substrate-binding protein [Acidovorax sp.]|uniref:ABC transporter substrate-binding protein n=1 Tax=Acidovorax sp. TaxID=1872122 RepID=UPI0039E3EDDF